MGANRWQHALDRAADQAWEVVKVNWHLGFTSFGGPPVHFKIFNDKFVQRLEWIDEQMYQELFSICQALCGPASTKMLYCINLIHGGFSSAVLAFFIWSLPGALAMFALSLAAATIQDPLPRAVYALLSGLNAAAVGIIALAAVELAEKAATDRLTRLLVSLAAAAGLMYNALWYFPVLVVASGVATVVYDGRWLHPAARAVARPFRRRSSSDVDVNAAPVDRETGQTTSVVSLQTPTATARASFRRSTSDDQPTTAPLPSPTRSPSPPRVIPAEYQLNMSWRVGLSIILVFLALFLAVMSIRAAIPPASLPLPFRLFANLLLAGTIIFGGGPVVIPLLREYVVTEGWVSPRDFLIGLAVAQAFPGPNFNFAVFLGGLAAATTNPGGGAGYAFAGAALAFAGIFAPGIILVHGTMGVWPTFRSRPAMRSAVRGLNAGAVGLIFTAVYRIWQVGYVDEGFTAGRALGDDPWWVVVAAVAYVGGGYFGVPPAAAIVAGASLGLARFGVVSAASG